MSRTLSAHIGLAGLLLMMACGSTTLHSDHRNARSHRRMAEEEESLAHQHGATGLESYSGDSPSIDMSRADDHAGDVYVPAGRHQGRAALHEELAREHDEVANSLTSFHAPTCGGMEAETLVVCPLLGPLTSVEDVDQGIELTVADSVDRDRLLARIQCHISFAHTGHGALIHQCPLYVPGLTASAGEGTHRILLHTTSPSEVERLRREVRQHLPTAE